MKIDIKPLKNNRTELYQWDTDRQIEITPDGGTVDEIHYATVMFKEALVVLPHIVGDTYVADIPNILLQSANAIHIYAVTHTDNGERTIDDTALGVTRRKKPSDYVYTETEVMRYEILENRIKELEDNQVSDETLNEMVNDYLTKNPIKIDVDKALSEESENPVENRAVARAIREVKEKIPTDYVTDEELGLLIKNLTTKITTLLDSDDATLDQTSEIVAYIKSNKSLIDAITTSKVSVDDIVDNLTTNLSNKPLSAAQGVKLKGLYDSLKSVMDSIDIPTQLSQLKEDATHRTVTDNEKEVWNDKVGTTELNRAVTESLQKAKDSGEFKGDPGEPGKTAYEYAKEGGYTGTENEFKSKMAADTVSVTYDAATKTLNISSDWGNT